MNLFRRILLCIYSLIIFIVGVYYIPCYLVFGTGVNKHIEKLKYVKIWELIDESKMINDTVLRYELCISRVIYQFLIISIIMIALYLVLGNIKKDTSTNK